MAYMTMSAVWRVLAIESILLGIVLGVEYIPKSWYRPGTILLLSAKNESPRLEIQKLRSTFR